MHELLPETKNAIWDYIRMNWKQFEQISDDIWDCPEIKFEEKKSCEIQRNFLIQEGFSVKLRKALASGH